MDPNESKFIGTWSTWWWGPGLISARLQIPPPDWESPVGTSSGLFTGHMPSSPTSPEQRIDGGLSETTANNGDIVEVWYGAGGDKGGWLAASGGANGDFKLILNHSSPNTIGGYRKISGTAYPWLGVRVS
jgi:hypothetical protein